MKTQRYTPFSPLCRTALLVVLGASGCNKQPMPIPDQLQQQSETLPISGNTAMGKTFAIGDFRVDEVKRGGKGTVSGSAGTVASASASKQ